MVLLMSAPESDVAGGSGRMNVTESAARTGVLVSAGS